MNALHLAVIGGCDAAVELLLAAGEGAGVDVGEKGGLLPLHLACRCEPASDICSCKRHGLLLSMLPMDPYRRPFRAGRGPWRGPFHARKQAPARTLARSLTQK